MHTWVSSQILPWNHFKGLTIGLQGHRHLSEINLIVKMNETIWAKIILYDYCGELSLYDAMNIQHAHFKKVYETKFIHNIILSFYQSKLNDRKKYVVMKSTRNSWTMNCLTVPSTDKRTDLWSRDFLIWRINSGLLAVGLGWTVK